jgi:hypothetical protein
MSVGLYKFLMILLLSHALLYVELYRAYFFLKHKDLILCLLELGPFETDCIIAQFELLSDVIVQ